MESVKQLIEYILSEVKAKGGKNLQSKVYEDEPILKTASQMANYLPPQYRKMRKIAKSYEAYRQTEGWLFYKQGKFMEDFEDDIPFHGDFVKYYPTYQAMNDVQLRGYFSWRTKVRHGQIEKTALSFVFVYTYELLNQIGVKDPEEGFRKLYDFWLDYRELDKQLDRYMKLWLSNYAVYYGLAPMLLEDISDVAFDKAALVLLHAGSYNEDEIFTALKSLSSYNIEKSKFYGQYPDDVKQVVCGVFARLAAYYEKNRKKSLYEKLFGVKVSCPYQMFHSAVFYDRMRYKNYEYVVNDIHVYRCKRGKWSCEKYYGNRGKNKEIGHILKTVDCLMRRAYAFKYPLKQDDATKILLQATEKEIESYMALKREQAVPKIEIDVLKLQGIRQAASKTREKLIMDEIPEELPAPAPVSISQPLPVQNEAGLNETEECFLSCLLFGTPYDSLVKQKGVMVSVLIDSINEKCYEIFGDTVITFNGDKPELIEDYAEELKGIVKK